MKVFLVIIVILFSLHSFAQNELIEVKDFGENKGNLKMYTYIPQNLTMNKSVPLVIVAHGCTQSAQEIAKETGWNKLADSLNFMIIYPEQKQINNAAKCFNFYIGFKAKKDKGEVASIRQMLNYCTSTYDIDSSKIFITGMSAGGAISNAVLNAYPHLFNAGVMISAPSNLFNPNKETNQPKVAIIQGTDDRIVPEKNADKTLAQWLVKHQLDTTSVELKKDYLNNPLLTAQYFFNAEKQVKIITIKAEGIKHKLLIKPGKEIHQGGFINNHTQDINFHSTYWIAQFFGLTN